MEISVRLNEVKLARMQESLSALQKRGMGFAGKYIDHETYTNKHTNSHYGSSFVERDVADKLERIAVETEIAKEFEFLSRDIAACGTAKEIERLQIMVIGAIEACVCKGYLDVATTLVKNLANGKFENEENKIVARDEFVRSFLESIVYAYAKMTRQCIKRPSEIVTLSGRLNLPVSVRNVETLNKKTREIVSKWQAQHPSTRSVLSKTELDDIEAGKQLSQLTKDRLELEMHLQEVIDKHTPFCKKVDRLLGDVYSGFFGDSLRVDDFLYIHLAKTYNNYMQSSNPRNTANKNNSNLKTISAKPSFGVWSDADEEIRKYADKQRVKTMPFSNKPEDYSKFNNFGKDFEK